MTYRLDDEGAFDRRRIGAGNEACGAVDRAGQWCAHELTDGVFEQDIAISIAPQKVWDKAALHRLIEKRDDGTYRIADFLQWNWSADKVRSQRDADKKRQSKRRHAECHAVTPSATPPERPPSEAAAVTALVQGEASASESGSDPDPEGIQGDPANEDRPSEVRIRRSDPPNRSPEHVAIALQIRSHDCFRGLDAHRLADHQVGHLMATGQKLEWVITAIDDCAAKKVGLGLTAEAMQACLVGYMRAARAPKRDQPTPGEAKGSSAYVEDDDEETVERIRRMPKRVTAQDAAKAAVGRKVGGA